LCILEKWKNLFTLAGIPPSNVDEYAQIFVNHGYESVASEVFLELTKEDLLYMGISKNAHQKMILMKKDEVCLIEMSIFPVFIIFLFIGIKMLFYDRS